MRSSVVSPLAAEDAYSQFYKLTFFQLYFSYRSQFTPRTDLNTETGLMSSLCGGPKKGGTDSVFMINVVQIKESFISSQSLPDLLLM